MCVRQFASGPTQEEMAGKPVYASYTIFKHTGALSLSLQKPRLQYSSDGMFLSLRKQGAVIFSFANPRDESQGKGFKWNERELFAVSAHELGSIIADDFPLLFTHKHHLDHSEIRKEMRIEPAANDSFDIVFHSFINEKPHAQTTMNLTKGEMAVIKSLAHSSLPHLLAWSLSVSPHVEYADDRKHVHIPKE